MSATVTIFALLAVYVAAFVIAPRIQAKRLERALREPLSQFLDKMLARARQEGEPYYDLIVETAIDAEGRIVKRTNIVYLTSSHYVCVEWEWRGRTLRYALTGRLPPALMAFPRFDRICRSFWFEGRMRLLDAYLASYPRERLTHEAEWRAIEALDASDPPPAA